MLNEAVNKRVLSTGETGEFVRENLGSDGHPGVEFAPPGPLTSNQREMADARNVRNVADTGEVSAGCWCQQKVHLALGHRDVGSPENAFSTFSLKIP